MKVKKKINQQMAIYIFCGAALIFIALFSTPALMAVKPLTELKVAFVFFVDILSILGIYLLRMLYLEESKKVNYVSDARMSPMAHPFLYEHLKPTNPEKLQGTQSTITFPVIDAGSMVVMKSTVINDPQKQVRQLEFKSLGGIKTQTVSEKEFLIFTQDYRSIKINRDEVKNFAMAILESEFAFYHTDTTHEIEIRTSKIK